MGNLVAIVGRPNVGKSTIFNRLTNTRRAIVNEEAGTTRDRQYGKVEWCGNEFSIIDTGGWVVNSDDIFEDEINKQVSIAIEEADVLLFVVDAITGVTDLDDRVAAILRRTTKPVIVVANKIDSNEWQYTSAQFYSFGLGDPFSISAANGSGTGDLLDEIISKFTKKEEETIEENVPRIAVVGRPNAGKSSIINAFIGEDRNIVTDIAGTTRDSIHTRYTKFGFDFYLVDTAGIRKKGKVTEDIEYYSVIRSIRAIEDSDVCVLMIDATRGIEGQDMNIFSLIQKNKKGLVVCVNKWDLVEDKSQKAIKAFEEAIRNRFAPFTDFPIIFTSALTKQRIFKVLECAAQVFENRRQQIPTARLNEEILAA
ncbi:MAG: ribosome biogenesis GTPase Der, partial [Coprobacter sp.]|nr:ribosome biogenesis GTPase Der [Coprobacter sp.]